MVASQFDASGSTKVKQDIASLKPSYASANDL
jgi:hypothetical protein